MTAATLTTNGSWISIPKVSATTLLASMANSGKKACLRVEPALIMASTPGLGARRVSEGVPFPEACGRQEKERGGRTLAQW